MLDDIKHQKQKRELAKAAGAGESAAEQREKALIAMRSIESYTALAQEFCAESGWKFICEQPQGESGPTAGLKIDLQGKEEFECNATIQVIVGSAMVIGKINRTVLTSILSAALMGNHSHWRFVRTHNDVSIEWLKNSLRELYAESCNISLK